MRFLELLAPARNADIGIAAIDCGADAVYIAGPCFGARQAASNSMADIKRLCEYAHRFGARIFLTVNTIIFDEELEEARKILKEAEEAGVDAIIAQDPAIGTLTNLPIHASTQCAIRTPQKASFYESLGDTRLVLERQMSLAQIKEIRQAVNCELEFFVHGALCVCYSGQCNMSEHISGRSANRGECIQACRSLYDLVDENDNVLVRNKALLSLKDYNLLDRLGDLADAGVDSFKIEGRLKNISYVRNVTRAYSQALDQLVARSGGVYARSSFGRVGKGFTPNLVKTFNRSYTSLFLDGKRGEWSSMDSPKSIGEEIGTITEVKRCSPEEMQVRVALTSQGTKLQNGDGFCAIAKYGIVGFRGDVCTGNSIRCKITDELQRGQKLFRNLDNAFEKELSTNLPTRLIAVEVAVSTFGKDSKLGLVVSAKSEDGRCVSFSTEATEQVAENHERMASLIKAQISKTSGIYSFTLGNLEEKETDNVLPFISVGDLNEIRRKIAMQLDTIPCKANPLGGKTGNGFVEVPFDIVDEKALTYKSNIANKTSEEIFRKCGAVKTEKAFELTHCKDAELMRTKYCIRYELGICPKYHKSKDSGHLFLVNNGSRYALGFDCKNCEMTVSAGPSRS